MTIRKRKEEPRKNGKGSLDQWINKEHTCTKILQGLVLRRMTRILPPVEKLTGSDIFMDMIFTVQYTEYLAA